MSEPKKEKEHAGPSVHVQNADLGLEEFGGEPLLKGVNWTVQPGEFWVVGGMHRSGKSTLLSTLAMLQKPVSGKITLFGIDPWGEDSGLLVKQRLRVGLVFEAGARLLHRLSLAENVALPVCYHQDCRFDEAEERVTELLEFAGVAELRQQLPGGLSRTYRQRANLARALALSPDVLLLDNPLAGMDLREQGWWQETVMKLWKGHPVAEGKPMTIVIATNHLGPWLAPGRKFALLHGNGWQQIGGVDELRSMDEPALRDVLGKD